MTENDNRKCNVSECKMMGIPFGVYLYSYALNAERAKAEAEAHADRKCVLLESAESTCICTAIE